MFRDRTHAAFLLAAQLKQLNLTNGIVLSIPRGGVPIGSIVAKELHFPLDLAMSKKLGHPVNPEFAIGSVTPYSLVLDDSAAQLPQTYVEAEVKRLREKLVQKYNQFTGGRKPYTLHAKNVIVVDDGLATGNTMLACIEDIRKQKPQSITVAVPVSSSTAANRVRERIDHFVCLEIPPKFLAVGEFYRDFSQVTDQLVVDLLANSNSAVTT